MPAKGADQPKRQRENRRSSIAKPHYAHPHWSAVAEPSLIHPVQLGTPGKASRTCPSPPYPPEPPARWTACALPSPLSHREGNPLRAPLPEVRPDLPAPKSHPHSPLPSRQSLMPCRRAALLSTLVSHVRLIIQANVSAVCRNLPWPLPSSIPFQVASGANTDQPQRKAPGCFPAPW